MDCHTDGSFPTGPKMHAPISRWAAIYSGSSWMTESQRMSYDRSVRERTVTLTAGNAHGWADWESPRLLLWT